MIPALTAAELQHIARFPIQFFSGFDDLDIDRLIIIRRAVRAGFYNDATNSTMQADERAASESECEFWTGLLPQSRQL